ncbi:MAG: Ig-like domain-containing protein [Vicinamibacterales bacterium]
MHARRLVACTIVLFALTVAASAQIPGQNVNMVSGTEWPGGDPFLQRQNEPSIAVSSRNPLHLLAGANDYRTVDLAGLLEAGATGDAWHGVFTSTDGGGRWTSTLLPGYPRDDSPEGLASPIRGLQAGADPFVRSAAYGLFFYGGLAFNRGPNQPSAIFVARYSDRNNKENGTPFAYEGTFVVARNRPGEFLDKPAFAVGLPKPGGGTCLVNGVHVPAPPVYAAWTVFVSVSHPHDGNKEGEKELIAEERSYMVFSSSRDCGETWTEPVKFSTVGLHQSAALAVDPHNPDNVYIAWRSFDETPQQPGQISVMRLKNGGRSFGSLATIGSFFPFDQGTTGTSFRTNSYPTMTIDEHGRVYVAWAARGYAPGNSDPVEGDARIVMSTALDGRNFTMPRAVDNFPGAGHQIMPELTYGGGRLQLVYYDLREDISGFFERFVDELTVFLAPLPRRRHTLDVRSAQASPGAAPDFTSYSIIDSRPSFQASRYLFGLRPGFDGLQQLQFNPPNLPLYALGTLPFIGDYIAVATQTFIPVRLKGTDEWRFNTNGNAVFHAVWTDNRDVVQPADGNWQNYTPPSVTLGGSASLFDPMMQVPACVPGQGGMRNSNIYTTRITPGLVAGSPGNAKGLSTTLQRAFVVFGQNTTEEHGAYRFRILDQPAGGHASFLQFDALPATPAYDVQTTLEPVIIGAKSSVARTVYVTSTDPRAQVRVEIVQVAGGGVPAPPPEGRTSIVILNPDIGNPDIGNPDIGNPDIGNPDIGNAEVYNPDIGNPDIGNPDIGNPDIGNPDIGNPDIGNTAIANPDIGNPDIGNPDIGNLNISNPDIGNPDIGNPDIGNGAITDYSYTVTENGNTASHVEVDLATAIDPAVLQQAGVHVQVLIHRQYKTPALALTGCGVNLVTQNQVIGNFANPFTPLDEVGIPNPLDLQLNNMSFWLAPGEQLKVTVRVIDEDRTDNVTFDPTRDAVIAVTAGSVSTNLPPGTPPQGTVQAPTIVAVEDAYEIEGRTLDVPAPGVRGNDTVRDGFTVTAVLVNGPENAAEFSLNPDGSFSYVAEAEFAGDDAFSYALAFGGTRSNVATVTIAVAGEEGGDPLVVVNTNDSGAGSLRAAIQFANAHENGDLPDRITFDIPGEGSTRRIMPSTVLPAVTDPVVIDGTTQPGYDGAPIVVIDGTNIDVGQEGGWGLMLTAGVSVVRGLGIVNVAGSGLVLNGGPANRIDGNWIGIDPATGLAAPNSRAGLLVTGGSEDHNVGTCFVYFECFSDRINVISGNTGAGVEIDHGNYVAIAGNRIGTTASGTGAVPNGEGIAINRAINTRIGGTEVGQGNLISGNLEAGIAVRNLEENPLGTVILGNVIGVGADGTTALPNGLLGIYVERGSGTVIGGAEGPVGNLVAHNGAGGIAFGPRASDNRVERNVIRSNQGPGIAVQSGFIGEVFFASQNNALLGNEIYANAGLGIDLAPAGPNANDQGDADAGANRLQNHPSIELVHTSNGSAEFTVVLDMEAGTKEVRVDFFNGATCGATSTNAQARRYLGSHTFTGTETIARFVTTLAFDPQIGNGFTATLSVSLAEVGTNTSELAPCVKGVSR